MKLFPRYNFKLTPQLPKTRLIAGLSGTLVFHGDRFTGDLVDKPRLKGYTFLSGIVENNAIRFQVQPSREYTLTTRLWLIMFTLILSIGIAHEIRNAYFTGWTLALLLLGFSVYGFSWIIYRITVRKQQQNMQRLIDTVTFGE